ncbi:MAG: hypothetical protein ABSB78_06040 [Bacteroidota bacterium]
MIALKPKSSGNHTILVNELIDIFMTQGFIIESAMCEQRFTLPSPIKNTKYGDQEDKSPDILAYDSSEKRSIIGMVCLGDGDLGSDETLTKFNVFLNCPVLPKEKPAHLFIIVPASKVIEATDVITHYLHPEYWTSIQIVSSKRIS